MAKHTETEVMTLWQNKNIIITAVRRMLQGVYFLPLSFFAHQTLNLRNGPVAPHQKYIKPQMKN